MPNSSKVYPEGLDLKTSTSQSQVGAEKTSTPAALATGGGGEDLHIHVGGGMENKIFNFKEELRIQMLWSLAAIKEGMVEFFNSEDNSSSEEELVKQVNAE